MTEDEMVGCHHQLDGLESEQAPGVGEGQGSCPPPTALSPLVTTRLSSVSVSLLLFYIYSLVVFFRFHMISYNIFIVF